MPTVYVCALSQVERSVREVKPSHLITLLDPKDIIATPKGLTPERHLRVGVNDITAAHPDYVAPESHHVERIVAFLKDWDAEAPLLVHCWAGVSRSSATAFIALCMNHEEQLESRIARAMRARAPHISPNRRIVALADDLLGRKGRMVDAVDRLGPGRIVFEGTLFGTPLTLDDDPSRS